MAKDPKTITLGTGTLTLNGVDVGYLSGDVNYKYSYEIEPFKSGQPKKLIKSATKEIVSSLTAGLAQLSAANMAAALGGLSVVSTSAPIVVPFGGSPSASQARTFSTTFGGYGLSAIRLDGPNVSSVTVKNAAENTTYSAGSDYIVLPGVGHIIRPASGSSIGATDTVHIAYTYNPGSLDTVNLGIQFSLARNPLVFTHLRQEDGKYVKITMPLAEASGSFDFNFAEETWSINNVTFNAVYDENTPAYPMGKIEFEQ